MDKKKDLEKSIGLSDLKKKQKKNLKDSYWQYCNNLDSCPTLHFYI